jgi:hypothetical protein
LKSGKGAVRNCALWVHRYEFGRLINLTAIHLMQNMPEGLTIDNTARAGVVNHPTASRESEVGARQCALGARKIG